MPPQRSRESATDALAFFFPVPVSMSRWERCNGLGGITQVVVVRQPGELPHSVQSHSIDLTGGIVPFLRMKLVVS